MYTISEDLPLNILASLGRLKDATVFNVGEEMNLVNE